MSKKSQARRQAKYDNMKAGQAKSDARRQNIISSGWHQGRLTDEEMNASGFHRNWRGKWVPN